ncbi:MAG: ABC transporter ATP-binding protein [Dehalococcoidia bacterium]
MITGVRVSELEVASLPRTSDAIELRDLVVVRGGNTVLAGISLQVPADRVTGIIGPSGCGKSTMMRSIVGVQRVRSGAVLVLGEPAGSASLRSRVGYTTQAPSAYRELSVREDLDYFRRIAAAPPERVDEALARLGLEDLADRRCGQLSGGQLHRVSLAAALLGSPELLVLDEPTVGIDPVLRGRLWELFQELVEGGVTIIISSHVMDEAERCGHLVLLRDGAVLATGSPAELRERTGSATVGEAFLKLVAGEDSPR